MFLLGLLTNYIYWLLSFLELICPLSSNALYLSAEFVFLEPYDQRTQGLNVQLFHHFRKDQLDYFSLILYGFKDTV
jgi:hypothetical protein